MMKSFKKYISHFMITELAIFLSLLISAVTASAAAEPSLKETSVTLYVGYKAYSIDINNISKNAVVEYVSSNSVVASVSDNGEVNPHKKGTSIITVTVKQNKIKINLHLKILVADPFIKIIHTKENIRIGDTYCFEIKTAGLLKTNIVWDIDNTEIAEINRITGKLTAIKEGIVTITVTDILSKMTSTCSIKMIPVEGIAFEYTVVHGEVTICGLKDKKLTELNIPTKIDGFPVEKIGNNAFFRNKKITKVIIPSSVKIIDTNAFAGCINITDLKLSDSLEYIGFTSFMSCHSLVSIVIPDSVITIEDGAFEDCRNLLNVRLPSGLNIIDEGVFQNCYSLKNIIIPDTVITISDWAFSNCKALSEITFPKGLVNIGKAAFLSCFSLRKILIPSKVSVLSDSAFYRCVGLQQVVMEEGVTAIGNYAFSMCSSLVWLKYLIV